MGIPCMDTNEAHAVLVKEDLSYVHTSKSAAQIKATLPSKVSVADLEMSCDQLDLARAKAIYEEYGCIVIRGLNRKYCDDISAHAGQAFKEALEMLEAGYIEEVQNEGMRVGWTTPNGTLFIPAPAGHVRSKQVMVLGLDYFTAASMLKAATDETTLDIVQVLLGSPDIELFGKGQCFFKEGISAADGTGGSEARVSCDAEGAPRGGSSTARGAPGGNPKYLHQDSAYFMFAKQGACATLNYTVRTDRQKDNGPLYVVPGSHKHGHIPHVDTASHLGVSDEWSFDEALCVEGDAGDAVFFHIHTLHGSTPNRSAAPRASFINRYITPDDYQAFFATDQRMRSKARHEYESNLNAGRVAAKERHLIVRGRREWSASGVQCSLNAKVNH